MLHRSIFKILITTLAYPPRTLRYCLIGYITLSEEIEPGTEVVNGKVTLKKRIRSEGKVMINCGCIFYRKTLPTRGNFVKLWKEVLTMNNPLPLKCRTKFN